MNLFRSKPPRAPIVSIDRRVRELEVVSSRLVRAGFAGQYHSAFVGKGVEFAQVREYESGDDVRTIDWNVTARRGSPHVKQFTEERDLTVILAVDVSASMNFGSVHRRKIEVAAELASVLSFAALQNGDRIGLLLFDERIRQFVPARRGRNHALRVVRSVVAATGSAAGRTSGDIASKFLERVAVKSSVICMISDFIGFGDTTPLERLRRRHDVVAVEISDPRERSLPARGMTLVRDAESGRIRLLDLAAVDVRITPAGERLRAAGLDVLSLSTTAGYDRELVDFFHRRGARRVR